MLAVILTLAASTPVEEACLLAVEDFELIIILVKKKDLTREEMRTKLSYSRWPVPQQRYLRLVHCHLPRPRLQSAIIRFVNNEAHSRKET